MSKTIDDLEAVRQITEILKPFEAKEVERILRWSLEKLDIHADIPFAAGIPNKERKSPELSATKSPKDLKGFIKEKKPNSNNQFATVVAYYYKFEASQEERKDSITSADLTEATRLANTKRLSNPIETLKNAFKAGLLSKGEGRGSYSINTVGENLVALSLPAQSTES